MIEARSGGSFDVLLKTYRLRAGLTQRQLADLSTLSERAIRDLESGRARSPRQETVRLLADGLRLGDLQRDALESATRRVVLSRTVVATNEPLAPPATITALVGRESEHRTVTDLLGTGAQRWVAIVGLGGVGKTQLSMEVAATLHSKYGISVLWKGKAEPIDPLDLEHQVRGRRTLLVLDGHDDSRVDGEHVLELLHHCPELRVLTTSRAPHRAAGECVFPLGPLRLPTEHDELDAVRLEQVPSVRLLLLSLRQARPDFRLAEADLPAIATLCHRLDGLPAALRTSAQWALMHTPRQLLALLADDPSVLVRAPGVPLTGFDVRDSVRSAMNGLDGRRRAMLATLAAQTGDWSVREASDLVHGTTSETSNGIYNLLLHGLIRRSETEGSRFTTLNLVRLAQAA